MNKHDIKQVQDALAHAMGKVTGVPIEDGSPIAQFVLPFVDRNGHVFIFYAYKRPRTKKIFLTDAGRVLDTLKASGMQIQMDVLQQVLKTFKLTVLEDGQVLEQTNRPLWQRVMALFQGLVTADGVLRTWTLPKEKE